MNWFEQLLGRALPLFTQPPTPWEQPLYTRPPVPDYFTPPKVDGTDYDWGEGLPKDVVQRNMPPSSAPSFEARTNPNLPWHGGASNYPGVPPIAAPTAPSFQPPRGPMQATEPNALAPEMTTERFGIPSPVRDSGTSSGPVPPPFPSTPPMNMERASRAPMGVFDPRNSANSVGAAPVADLKTSFTNDEFKNRLLIHGEGSHLVDPKNDPEGLRAISPKGAKGIAQFMDATWNAVGKMMGRPADAPGPFDKNESMLRYNWYMDHLLKKYNGNQRDVAVAYNAGEGFANKWIAAGRPPDMLPGETRRYIANIFGGKSTQYASSSPDTATTSASPTVESGEPLRSAKTAPVPDVMAPRRPPFDWGPDANLWPMLMQAGTGMMKPTLYGTWGAIQQGLEGATQAAQTGPDRALKRELLKAQVDKAKSGDPTEDMRNYRLAVAQGYKGTILDFMRDKASGKAPSGYQFGKNGELEPIPGGPATTIPSEQAGRLALATKTLEELPAARAAFLKEWSTGDVFKAQVEMGDIGRAQRVVRGAIESGLRLMTGAAAPESEVANYMGMFMPKSTDTIETRRQKLDLLESFMRNAIKVTTAGRGNPLPATSASPVGQTKIPRLNSDGSWQ